MTEFTVYASFDGKTLEKVYSSRHSAGAIDFAKSLSLEAYYKKVKVFQESPEEQIEKWSYVRATNV